MESYEAGESGKSTRPSLTCFPGEGKMNSVARLKQFTHLTRRYDDKLCSLTKKKKG